MNRIDRLSAILIQLQSRPLVKAQDIADRFSISLRTVYRDVKALEEGGVPIIGEAGTGYRLMEGYKLPPIHFNQDEASALLTGAKLMQSMSDAPTSGHYQSALDKIRAVLRRTEKHQMANLDDHIAVVAHPTFVYSKPTELHLSKILQAIAANVILELTHTSASRAESLRRNVEPIGIYYQGSHWYLVAYCHLRREYRNFRTDRINGLRLTEEKMTQSHPPLQNFLSRVTEKKNLEKVVIDVNASIAKYFGEQKYYNGFVTEEKRGDMVRMTFLTSCLTGFSRWFLLYADEATILEPLELQETVAAHAEKILQKLEISKVLLT
ncbi:YafY family transcriptional regulator [Flavisolibacter sp. BT320]|nr:YafY family transcriptional regulator [Flavisolibacter longurius]